MEQYPSWTFAFSYGRLVGRHRGVGRARARDVPVGLFLRHDALVQQFVVALQLRGLQRRLALVTRDRRLGLVERRDERPVVERHERVALLHELARVVMHLFHDARDLRFD